jgi:selenoprotein W-related protein
LEEELKFHYDNIDVTLIEGSGGVFDVYFNNELIFSKKLLKRFPVKGEIINIINEK